MREPRAAARYALPIRVRTPCSRVVPASALAPWAAAICSRAACRRIAQSTATLVGVVLDSSGAALPGATVEVASPALIERVKVTITADDGRYRVVDLRPGDYTVTFSLGGFQTLRREHVALTTTVTTTVDAALSVGALED